MLEANASKECGGVCRSSAFFQLFFSVVAMLPTRLAKVGGYVGHCVSSGPEAQPVQSAMVTQPVLFSGPALRSPCGPLIGPGSIEDTISNRVAC